MPETDDELRWSQASRAGQGAGTQDRVAVEHVGSATVVVVADGAGGQAGGGRAAELGVQGVLESCRREVPADAGELCVLISEVDRMVAEDTGAGLAALAVVVVTPARVLAASVDDAEVWLWTTWGWQLVDARYRYGSGLGIGSSVALVDVAELDAKRVIAVIVWSDGARWTWTPERVERALHSCESSAASCLLPTLQQSVDDASVIVGLRADRRRDPLG